MSDRERNELLAAGKCFKCKEAGHVARQCPNFSIGIDFDQIEESRQLAATTEELYGVGVGSVSFDLEAYPQLRCLKHTRRDLGDCTALIATRQLQAAQPYPGDPWDGEPEDHRFCVGGSDDDNYFITDSLWYATQLAERLGLDWEYLGTQ